MTREAFEYSFRNGTVRGPLQQPSSLHFSWICPNRQDGGGAFSWPIINHAPPSDVINEGFWPRKITHPGQIQELYFGD